MHQAEPPGRRRAYEASSGYSAARAFGGHACTRGPVADGDGDPGPARALSSARAAVGNRRSISWARSLPQVRGIQWGTVGEMGGGAAAGGALLYAFVTRHRDRQADAQRARRTEAGKVNAWFTMVSRGKGDRITAELTVHNSTDAPLYDWEAAMWWVRSGPPGPGPHVETRVLDATNVGPIAPHDRLTQEVFLYPDGPNVTDDEGNPVYDSAHTPDAPARDCRVAVTWRDARGEWWLRVGGDLRNADDRWPLPWAIASVPLDVDEMARIALDSHRPRRRIGAAARWPHRR